ncbi:hypothetical protein B0X04_21710, partial [Yersinia pestis]
MVDPLHFNDDPNGQLVVIPSAKASIAGKRDLIKRLLLCATLSAVTNGAIVIHTQRLKSDPGGN